MILFRKEEVSTLPSVRKHVSIYGEHPSTDELERYLINHLPDDQTAVVERHVFSCSSCLSRTKLLDLEDLAVVKACEILSGLERQGIRMLSVPALAEQRLPQVILTFPAPSRKYNMQYAAVAATVVLTVASLSSVTLLRNRQEQRSDVAATTSHSSPRTVYTRADSIESSEGPVSLAPVTRPPRKVLDHMPVPIVQTRYARPFVAPHRTARHTPEPRMAFAAPVVLAERVEPTMPITRDFEVPKPVARSKRVFQAIASPIKKVGGALASIAVGDL